ncbi:MAG: tetraacyldisaccharide 4'-kinase, partial [Steroidobacteraceae bacterium]
MQRQLTELWYGPRGSGSLLQPLAWAYGRAVRLRRAAYARGWLQVHALDKPVVVVGNLTVGGTGKTPLTLWLIEALAARGIRAGVVSRGYGRRSRSPGPQVVGPDSRWQEVGDEPWLMHRRAGCPVVVYGDRAAAAARLAVEPVDVLLCDDGLQHLALARDCEIAVIDGTRGLGNGRLLPAGPLREPPARLRGVDVIVVNGSSGEGPPLDPAIRGVAAPVLRMRLEMTEARRVDGAGGARPLEQAFPPGGRVHAVAGIGHPARFFGALEAHGLEVLRHAFADHHAFMAGELDFPDELPI